MPDGVALRSPNVNVPDDLLEEARHLAIDASKVCRDGLTAAIASETRKRAWIAENREAMESWNRYVRQHGIPLADWDNDSDE